MDGIASVEAAAPLWRAVVDLILEDDTGVPEPQESATLARRDVCRLTGRIPTEASPGIVREWFLRGTEPTESAAVWFRRTPDGRTVLTLPPEYTAWCASAENHLGAQVAATDLLEIRQPAAGAEYALDPTLPRAQQVLRLEATLPEGAVARWTIDGREIAPQPGDVLLWPLEPGTHRAKATAKSGQAQVDFTVRE